MKTLNDLINSPNFQPFGSTSDDWINDGDRMARCHEAAENGAEGSTHAEVIQDWRDFLNSLTVTDEWRDGDLSQNDYDSIDAEIDACEAWHEEHGSLHQEIG